MAQARRGTGRSAGRQMGASSHGFGMFAAGLVVGAVAASFFMGLRSDDPESIGRGIEHMITASKNRFTAADEPSAPVPEKKSTTEFDFYMLLPEIEHVVPDNGAAEERMPAETSAATAATPPGASDAAPAATPAESPAAAEPAAAPTAPIAAHFELQAGAFVRLADADRLKAELALKGLSARIQKVSIEGRGDFYRVRLGPYSSTGELEAVDRQLAGLGIDALRLKVSGS